VGDFTVTLLAPFPFLYLLTSVYQTVDQVGTCIGFPWSFQFSNCTANLTISNPIRTSNCNLETV